MALRGTPSRVSSKDCCKAQNSSSSRQKWSPADCGFSRPEVPGFRTTSSSGALMQPDAHIQLRSIAKPLFLPGCGCSSNFRFRSHPEEILDRFQIRRPLVIRQALHEDAAILFLQDAVVEQDE